MDFLSVIIFYQQILLRIIAITIINQRNQRRDGLIPDQFLLAVNISQSINIEGIQIEVIFIGKKIKNFWAWLISDHFRE